MPTPPPGFARPPLGFAEPGNCHRIALAVHDGRGAFEQWRRVFGAGVMFDTVRIVIEFADWSGMSGGAMWEDLKLGIERFTKWKKIALVTDVDWMRHATNLFGWMTPGDVKTFSIAERDAAVKWAATP